MSTQQDWEPDPHVDYTPHASAPGRLVRKVVIVYDDGEEVELSRFRVGPVWHKHFDNASTEPPFMFWTDHEITWRTPRPDPRKVATDG